MKLITTSIDFFINFGSTITKRNLQVDYFNQYVLNDSYKFQNK